MHLSIAVQTIRLYLFLLLVVEYKHKWLLSSDVFLFQLQDAKSNEDLLLWRLDWTSRDWTQLWTSIFRTR